MTDRMDAADDALANASIAEIQQRVAVAAFSSNELIAASLANIARWDKTGPALRAMLSVNPHAQEIAGRAAVGSTGSRPLRGLPVVVKDNCDTADMPTTGGSAALANNRPATDSTVVRRLKEAGAIIVGKTNLHELALAGLTVSSLGGQTRNPYDLGRTPGGSSGGSGVALAVGYAVAAIGTDTVNSIRSPASANCIVGLRPTRGLVSRAGVIPCSSTQDAVGPMARNVEDLAKVLDVIAGYDPGDATTACCIGRIAPTYTAGLERTNLSGCRIGFVRALQGSGSENEDVNRAVENSMAAFRSVGAETLSLEERFVDPDYLVAHGDVQKWEFKRVFNAYLRDCGTTSVRSLKDFIATGAFHHETLETFLHDASAIDDPGHDPEYLSRLAAITDLRGLVLNIMAQRNLDALAYPLQRCLAVPIGSSGQTQRNGILASLIGFPALTVPMGFSEPTPAAPLGVPMGLDILARPFEEIKLIGIGHVFERMTHIRRPPDLYNFG